MRYLLLAFSFIGLFQNSLFCAIDSKVDHSTVHEAFVPKISAVLPIEMISHNPPTERIEKPPQKTNPLMKWIPGYWEWDKEKQEFDWVCGVWRIPPPKHEWVPGYWKRGAGWYWISGLWHAEPSQAILSPEAPPAQPEENVGSNANSTMFWAPGHWNYNPYEQNFRWLGGSWVPFDEEWVYFPSSWTWRPEGYLFHPAYWDFPLEERGVAFSCNDKEQYDPLTNEVILSRIYYTFPERSHFFWHHFHFHPEYWKGCWCLPSWWEWHSWWTLNWQDQWNLWWWWAHPGFPQPYWLTADIAGTINPPEDALITLFKGGNLPYFFTSKGLPNEATWTKALYQVTNIHSPLVLDSKLAEVAQNAEALIKMPPEVLRPTGSGIRGEKFPKPVIGTNIVPYDRAILPPKPQPLIPQPKILSPPAPKILDAIPENRPQPSPLSPEMQRLQEMQHEMKQQPSSPFISSALPATPAPEVRKVLPRPVPPNFPSPTWIEGSTPKI